MNLVQAQRLTVVQQRAGDNRSSLPHVCVRVCVCVCAAVALYCHSDISVQARFLYRAQDLNMTNGDFAWFTPRAFLTWRVERLWEWYASRVEVDPDELPRRRRAFLAVKQVLLAFRGVEQNT